MPIHWTTRDRERHLKLAANLTRSGGWRADAIALAAYDRPMDDPGAQLRGVFVFQNFDAFGADLHVALAAGRRNTNELMTDLFKIAFLPTRLNLPALRAFIATDNTAVIRFAVGLGWSIVARLPGGVLTMDDAILLTIRREDAPTDLPVGSS